MIEKRLLQIAVILACVVPITAGFTGAFKGSALLAGTGQDLDSHFRYLSGLLLGIGFAFLSTVPHIETQTARFRTLTFIVFLGGLSRLYGVVINGLPGPSMQFGLCMELIITPLLCLWQSRISSKN